MRDKLALIIAILLPLIYSQAINITISSLKGDRLTKHPQIRFESLLPNADFLIDSNLKFQQIDGFGASFLEAGLLCLNDLPKDQQESLL